MSDKKYNQIILELIQILIDSDTGQEKQDGITHTHDSFSDNDMQKLLELYDKIIDG